MLNLILRMNYHLTFSKATEVFFHIAVHPLTRTEWGPPYTSESDIYRRQILTYKDDPALKELKYL